MKVLNYLLWLAALALSFYVLLVAKDLLLPLLIAVILWYLINALTKGFGRLSYKDKSLPPAFCFVLSIISILGVLSGIITLLTNNIADVINTAPVYEQNFERVISRIFALLRMQEPPTLRQLLGNVDITTGLSQLAVGVTTVAGNIGIILVYLLFIFLEQKSFNQKMRALIRKENRREELFTFVHHIESRISVCISVSRF